MIEKLKVKRTLFICFYYKSISLFDTGCANVRFLHAISGLVNVNIYICLIRIKAKTIFG